MIKLSKLYILGYLLIVLFVFIIGGIIQFFIGVPNTVFTYGILILFFVFYLLYIIVKKRVFIDKVIALHFLLATLIIASGLHNKTEILKVLIYLIFILVPLGCYVFFKINKKEHYLSITAISKIYLLIACIQLPIVLFQKVGYDFLIPFNRSSQLIASFDFMFGSFFLKADHSLGFFLFLNILNITENNINNRITKYPKLVFLYLAVTILVAESNISKLLLILYTTYIIYKSFPKKAKIIGLITVVLFLFVGYTQIKKTEAFDRQLYFIEKEYNPKKSFRNYERGIAKRPQVVITYLTKLPLRVIGKGPYSYFNVLKGKFTNSKHFSQLIWAYADLGIIGLILVIFLLYYLIISLELPVGLRYIMFTVIIIYGFMTTIFSDLAIMITFISLLQNRKQENEHSNSSIS